MKRQDLEKIYSIEDIAQEYDALLFDVWGVIIMDSNEGMIVAPLIAERLNRLIETKHVCFVSNYACFSDSLELKLKNLGIDVRPGSVFTAGRVAKELLSDPSYLSSFFTNYKGQSVPSYFQLGDDNECDIFAQLDFKRVHSLKEADLLLISVHKKHPAQGDPQVVQTLKEASALNLPAVCLNPDAHFVGPNGLTETYCAGYFAARYEQMGGKVLYIGKPFEQIFLHVFQQTNLRPKLNKILMVGDTLTTDILGGSKVGIDTALVTTGNAAFPNQDPNNNQLTLAQIRLHCQLHRIYPTHVVSMSM
jgi:HAD superfamily hydrolase (TIGR01459 family)